MKNPKSIFPAQRHRRRRLFFVSAIAVSIFFMRMSAVRSLSLALVDTSDRDAALYQPFIDAATRAGFAVTYKPLDLIIEQTSYRLALPRYDAAFFILGSDFLAGNPQGHLRHKVMQMIKSYACLRNKIIGLLFPSLNAGPGTNVVGSLAPLFDCLGVKVSPWTTKLPPAMQQKICMSLDWQSQAINDFLNVTNMFLSVPPELRPLPYHTTLNKPRAGLQFNLEQICGELLQRQQRLCLLPLSLSSCPAQLCSTLPYGVYWFNPLCDNHVIIGNGTLVKTLGIVENFQLCPIDWDLRCGMQRIMQHTLHDIAALAKTFDYASFSSACAQQKNILEPARIVPMLQIKRPQVNDRLIAWMEINCFEQPTAEQRAKDPMIDQSRAEQQKKLVEYIVQSGLQDLWITFNPHMYYSPIARCHGPEKEKKLWDSISLFTEKLHAASVYYKRTVPSILVGFEITNNVYEPNLPTFYPIDVYEHAYKDLPVPLDKAFWHREISKPLAIFVQKWSDKTISHGVPLAGVVIDWEMYCRKKTGLFSTAMSIDAFSFQQWSKQSGSRKKMTHDVPVRDRVLSLMSNGRARNFFSYAEKQAEALGRELHESFLKIIPQCRIMCYLPNIQTTWFYKGMYKGLAASHTRSHAAPLYLLTFNSEFLSHANWFSRNRIPVKHACVLLLSKLTSQADFGLVDAILARHHGIWLNRFSRFAEPVAKDWTAIEQPGLPEALYPEYMRYMQAKRVV